jgi:hypothetical protein
MLFFNVKTLPPPLPLMFVSMLYAGFDLSVEPGIGFQTGVPTGPADSIYSNYPFGAFDLEPAWTSDTGKTIRSTVACPISMTKYFGGPYEVSIAQDLSFKRMYSTHTVRYTLTAAYCFMPTALNPTIPEKFMEYCFEYERENTDSIPLTGTYRVSLLHEIATSRMDISNILQLKNSWNISSSGKISGKIGVAWNVSNRKGAGYIQPLAGSSVTWAVNEKNLLLFQLFATYSYYEPMDIPVWVTIQRGKSGKEKDTLSYILSEPEVPYATLYCGFDREMSVHTNVHFYYMVTLFGRGQPHSLSVSHHTGILYTWCR